MADHVITPVTLSANVASADLVGVGTSVAATDTFSITADGNTRTLQIFMEQGGSGASTVTFDPGTLPPSFLKDRTTSGLVISLATSDLRELMVEPGEFIQGDTSVGRITGSVQTNTVKIYALRVSNEI